MRRLLLAFCFVVLGQSAYAQFGDPVWYAPITPVLPVGVSHDPWDTESEDLDDYDALGEYHTGDNVAFSGYVWTGTWTDFITGPFGYKFGIVEGWNSAEYSTDGVTWNDVPFVWMQGPTGMRAYYAFNATLAPTPGVNPPSCQVRIRLVSLITRSKSACVLVRFAMK